jgi:hypothetical protein
MSARRAATLAVTPPRADRIQVVADAFADDEVTSFLGNVGKLCESCTLCHPST